MAINTKLKTRQGLTLDAAYLRIERLTVVRGPAGYTVALEVATYATREAAEAGAEPLDRQHVRCAPPTLDDGVVLGDGWMRYTDEDMEGFMAALAAGYSVLARTVKDATEV